MNLKIITHEKVVFDGEVEEIYSRGIEGEFGVLKDHIPFMTTLDVGVTKVVSKSGTEFFTTMGGIFQFKDNEAKILTDIAEAGPTIDVTRAKEAKERAATRLAEAEASIDAKRAEAALARAMARLKAALNK